MFGNSQVLQIIEEFEKREEKVEIVDGQKKLMIMCMIIIMTMSEMTVMTMKKAWIVIERPKLKITSVCGGYREDLSVDIDDSTRYTAKKQIRICECIEGLKKTRFAMDKYKYTIQKIHQVCHLNQKNTPNKTTTTPSQSKAKI